MADAHLGGAGGKPHDLFEHLRDVARRAGEFARAAAPGDPAFAALAEAGGWLHDLGKDRRPFQEYLHGRWAGPEKEKRHAVYGAAAAMAFGMPSLAFAILGHHAGLHDYEAGLKASLQDVDLRPTEAAEALLGRLEAAIGAPASWRPKVDDPLIVLGPEAVSACLDLELRARMLFSCLVDADHLDTERYYDGVDRESEALDAPALAGRLREFVDAIEGGGGPGAESPIAATRRAVREACLRRAGDAPGLFSLTAPTGSGKTLAAMGFALEHARAHGLRRVIVVLPFLAIIDQNARVYREALNRPGRPGVVLEHHSAVVVEDGDDRQDAPESAARRRNATQNWDAPVVVTTAVQFLESLFSRRPSRCRKLHNIARSVVVLDEVQTLPFPLLEPILSALGDLSAHFGVSALLCSATRPTFRRSRHLPSGLDPGRSREVVEARSATFEALARARLELPARDGPWTWDDLADRLRSTPKALIIVNLRKHAQEVYDVLKGSGRFPNLHHLSSTMCAEHREAVLGRRADPAPGTIYADLASDDCVVVSTQVIEAGVDIDFPVVYRMLAPLDSIIQAAGRCDREGDLTAAAGSPAGRVIVFEPAARPYCPAGYYERATQLTRRLLLDPATDPGRILVDPALFERFHQKLIASGEGAATGAKIQEERRALNFKAVDGLFKIIDDAGRGVIVVPPEEVEVGFDVAAYLDSIREEARIEKKDRLDARDRRRLQRLTVSLLPDWVEHFRRRDQIRPLIPGQEDGLLVFERGYDRAVGVRVIELPPETFLC